VYCSLSFKLFITQCIHLFRNNYFGGHSPYYPITHNFPKNRVCKISVLVISQIQICANEQYCASLAAEVYIQELLRVTYSSVF